MAGNRFTIETIFKGIDAMSSPMKRMERSLKSAGVAMAKLTARAAAIGGAALTAGVVVATKQYIEFEQSLRKAGAAFSDFANLAGDDAEKALKDLGASARAVASTTEFDANQAAQALETMAKAGLSSDQAVASLSNIADIATAAGLDMNSATDLILSSVNSLGMASDDPLIMAKNMQHLGDVMSYTADSAMMSMSDFGEMIKVVGARFDDANGFGLNTVNTLSAVSTALAKKGFVGSESGKAVSSIFSRIMGGAANAGLEALGLNLEDADTGAMKNMATIIDEINGAFKRLGLTEMQQGKITKQIFGQNYQAQGLALLKTGGDAIRQFEENAINSAGSALQKATKIRMSIKNQMAVLLSGLTEMGFQFVEGFENPFTGALNNINNKIAEMNKNGAMAEIGKQMEPLVAIVEQIVTSLINNLPSIISAFTRALSVIISIVSFVWQNRGLIEFLAVLGGSIMAIVNVINAVKAAQAALNIVMSANPVGLIVVAVGALIAGLVILWNTCEPFRNFIISIGTAILDFILFPLRAVTSLLSKLPGIGGAFGKLNNLIGGNAGQDAPIAPMTQADRMIYSQSETTNNSNMTIGLEKGLTAQVTGKAPNITIDRQSSGTFRRAG